MTSEPAGASALPCWAWRCHGAQPWKGRKMSSSPELASYNSAISRCGKSNKSWPKVLELLHLELPEVGLQANTVSYNAVSNSVRQGAWSLALESLRICQQLLRADVVTINSAIRACNRLPRWPATLQILEEAVQDGLEMETECWFDSLFFCTL